MVIKFSGASKVLRQFHCLASQLAPLLEIFKKTTLSVVSKFSGASNVLRQFYCLASHLAPLLEKIKKTTLSVVSKFSGASKGARTLDLNLGKVAL